MNYKEIILDGFFDLANRDNFDTYLFREFKKAEKDYIEPDDFFRDCLSVINSFEFEIDNTFQSEKDKYFFWLNEARRGKITEDTTDKRPIETRIKEEIERYEKEIAGLDKNNIPLNFGNYRTLYYPQILPIHDAIIKAYYKVMGFEDVLLCNLNRYLKVVDFKRIELNPHRKEQILFECDALVVSVKSSLSEYFKNHERVSFEIHSPLYLICKVISELPKIVIDAHEKHPNDSEAKFRYIKGHVNPSVDRFLPRNNQFESTFNFNLAQRNKDALINLFVFVDTFIRELKSTTTGIRYFKTNLFQLLFKKITDYKKRYEAVFDKIDFESFREVNNLLGIDPDNSSNEALPPHTTRQPLQESSKSETNNVKNKQIEILKQIWLAEPKISIDEFLQKGIEKGIWNESYEIITKRGSLYGKGKTLIGSLSVALKGWAINENTDYKIVGTCFCDAFNIKQKESTKNPYKAFSTGNPKIIKEFKRAYKIN